jgi:hypothetical protein
VELTGGDRELLEAADELLRQTVCARQDVGQAGTGPAASCHAGAPGAADIVVTVTR